MVRRLIPAHAGKTRGCCRVASAHAAHPRSRGENVGDPPANPGLPGSSPLTRGKPSATALPSPGVGSSPLTRGKRLAARSGHDPRGLIPAHAGKTSSSQAGGPRYRAHPRSRGENATPAKDSVFLNGSSPLTRGKRRVHRQAAPLRRLIPAHAGKTSRGPSKVRASTAHPRSRGENYTLMSRVSVSTGSSPLTRGKPRPMWT